MIKALLIEDDQVDALSFQRALANVTHTTFDLTVADTLAAGQEQLEQTTFDVVIADLTLPDSDGLDTFTGVQACAPDVPIVVLTGLVDEELARKAVSLGAQDYLLKGQVDGQLLLRALHYAMERHRLLRHEHRFRKIIEENAEGVLIVDRNNRVNFANSAAESLFGRPASEILGDFSDLPVEPNNQTEFTILRDDGDTRVAEFYTADIEWEGESARMISLRDITKHRRNQAALQRQLQELKALHALALASTESDSENTLITRAIEVIGETFRLDNFEILLVDESTNTLHAHPTHARTDSRKDATAVSPHQGIVGRAVDSGKVQRVDDCAGDPDLWETGKEAGAKLCAPLKVGNRVVGVIDLQSETANAFTAEDERLLETLASQLVTAIEKIRLDEAKKEHIRFVTLLNEITQAAISSLDSHERMQTLVDKLGEMLYADACYFTLWDEENDLPIPVVAYGLSRDDYPNVRFNPDQQTFTASLLEAGHTLLVDDAMATPYLSPELASHFSTRSLMGVPLIVDEQKLGAIIVGFDTTHKFREQEIAYAEQAAGQIALAVAKAKLFEEAHRRTAELETLVQVSATLRVASSVDDMLATIMQIVGSISAVSSSIFLVEPQTGDLVVRASYPSDTHVEAVRHRPGEGITGHVALTGKAHISEDLAHDPLARIQPAEAQRLRHIRSNIALPLRVHDQTVGVMHVGLSEQRHFTEREIRLLRAIADVAGSALDRAMMMETLEQRVQRRTRELAKANERLKEMDRLRAKFVSDMSHELRTPVTNFRLYLDLLERGHAAKRQRYVDVLRYEVQRLEQLIEQALSLSRLDLGKDKVRFSSVDLNQLIDDALITYRYSAEEAGLTLRFDPDKNLPLVHGEKSQLAQVISKLLDNAIRYTPAGSVHIATYLSANGEKAAVEVQDTGIGIDPAEKPHLFERFYRGERTGQSNIPGAGLGLAIVKEIVDLHKGTVEVESEVDEGSMFRVWLPLANMEA